MTKIQELLAQNMKEARKRFGISQLQLAELCGVSTAYIGEIEIMRKFPSAKTLQKIADALKLEPYQLFFTGTDWTAFDRYQVLTELLAKMKDKISSDIEELIKAYL